MYEVITESDMLSRDVESKWDSLEYARAEFLRQSRNMLRSAAAGSVTIRNLDHMSDFSLPTEVAFFRFDPSAATGPLPAA